MVTNCWVSRQVDFVLAFPQADIECEMFMEVPRGFHINGNRRDYALRLDKNLYGQKQAGHVWNAFMHGGLLAQGFAQSSVNMCVYYGVGLWPNQLHVSMATGQPAQQHPRREHGSKECFSHECHAQ
jgi:Reverse transcriptase (RNA-dependent DNA polymerase)